MGDASLTLMAEAGDGMGGGGEAAPWHTSILTAEGRFSPGWVDRLPENLSEHRAMLSQYGDLETLARAHKDSMTAARAKTEGMVRVPGPDARPEETAAWRKALGVPEAPDGYGIRQPEKLPDGVAWDEPLARKFAARAHELGLTPAQVRSLQEFQVGMVGEQVTAARGADAGGDRGGAGGSAKDVRRPAG